MYPKIQVIDIFFKVIDILFCQWLLYDLEEMFIGEKLIYFLICGSYELMVGAFYHMRYFVSYESFEELYEFLVFDVQSDVFGIDVLENGSQCTIIERFEEWDIGINILDVVGLRENEFLFPALTFSAVCL